MVEITTTCRAGSLTPPGSVTNASLKAGSATPPYNLDLNRYA